MNLNSDTEDDDGVEEEELVPLVVNDDDCRILEVRQAMKRRKPTKIGQRKKRNGKPPSAPKVVAAAPKKKEKQSARKRYNSESEEAVSDTESEDDAAGKEGRLQRRTIKRIRKCITDPKELQRFAALSEQEQVFYRPTRARTQTAIMNITSHKSPVGRTPGKFYDKTHAKAPDQVAASSHDDTDEDYREPVEEQRPPVVVPPKKRKVSAESLPTKKKSLQHILNMVSTPIHLPTAPAPAPAPAPKPVQIARASWRRPKQAPQPVVDAVALGRPIHGDVGMLNAGSLRGALPKSLAELVRQPRPPPAASATHPPPAAHLLPSAPSTRPTLEWKRVPETPRMPSRYWNRGGPVVRNSFSQPPRPRSPPRDRRFFDTRFTSRYDREWNNRGPRW
jgi:hypothetical protein